MLVAFLQWRRAGKFQKAMDSLLNSVSPPEHELEDTRATPTRMYRWTMMHSYYVCMGGFAFDRSKDPSAVPLHDGRLRLTLTPAAILFFARHEPALLPDLSQEHIVDRSKTNAFAKTIVCIQASWFSLSVVSRLGIGLPISLLELNTFAHVLFAIFIYRYWWSKPLDVTEPTLIDASKAPYASLCAAMCLRSSIYYTQACEITVSGAPVRTHGILEWAEDAQTDAEVLVEAPSEDLESRSAQESAQEPQGVPSDELPEVRSKEAAEYQAGSSRVLLQGKPQEECQKAAGNPAELLELADADAGPSAANLSQASTPETGTTPSKISKISNAAETSGEEVQLLLAISEPKYGLVFRLFHDPVQNRLVYGAPPSEGDARPPVKMTIPREILPLFEVAAHARGTYEELRQSIGERFGQLGRLSSDMDFVTTRAKNIMTGTTSFDIMWADGIIVGAIYGGVHLLAWNAPFATRTESILWRISAVAITAPIVAAVVVAVVFVLGVFISFVLLSAGYVEAATRAAYYHIQASWAQTRVQARRTVSVPNPMSCNTEAGHDHGDRQSSEPTGWPEQFEKALTTGYILHFLGPHSPWGSSTSTGDPSDQQADLKAVFAATFHEKSTQGPKFSSKWVQGAVSVVFLPLFVSCILLYFLARVFILLEIYISLAYAPPAVFLLPNWSSYIPHIS